MMKTMRRAAFSFLALALLTSCVSSKPCDSGRDRRVLQIQMTDGGPSPAVTLLALTQDGTAVFRAPTHGSKEACEKLASSTWNRLQQHLESPDLAKALDAVRQAQYQRQFYDYPGIRLVRGELETFVPCEKVPDALVPLLRLLDETFSEVFGRRYDIRLTECVR